MYDAKLGRFLSPDNFVQNPYNTQNFNRYGYVLNNPLMYSDPSGEIIPLLIIGAVALGAYFGGAQANGSYNPLNWNYSTASTWVGIIGGGIIGGVSAGIGTAIAGGTTTVLASVGINGGAIGGALSGLASGAVAGGFSGAFMSVMPGGNGNVLNGMWKSAVMGGVMGFGIGGIIGYYSIPKGYNPWNGNHNPITAVRGETIGASSIDNPIKSYDSRYQKPSDIKLPNKLSHYTSNDPSSWTSIGQLQDKSIFLTNNENLSRIGALNDLSLPKAPNYRIDVIMDGVEGFNNNFNVDNIRLIRRVTGNVYGQGGGGWEVIYKGPLDLTNMNIIITQLP